MEPGQRFTPGAPVRVRAHFPPGHVRTPWYCRGQVGEVERLCGFFPNPEQLAYGNREAARTALYRVGFPCRSLWPEYSGGERDRVEIELYDHWLEPAAGETK